MKATIFKIDRMNTHNGPGFRTVIYFKGCPLHCTWCHNPEGINPKKEVWFNAAKCIACGTCVEHCPEDALNLSENGIIINREKCTGCQLCTDVCPAKAMEKIGESYSVDDLMKIISQDKILFDSSGGGVTVTGGEPGMQPEFVAELFKRCQKEGIHTAFDTSGVIPEIALNKILPHSDLIFLDIKLLVKTKLMYYTGLPLLKLEQTISCLNTFQENNPDFNIEVRTPLVPGVNDDNESLNIIGRFISKSFMKVPNWELCMFNDLCEDKYQRMGKNWTFEGKKHNAADYTRFNEIQQNLPLAISITGFVEHENKKQ